MSTLLHAQIDASRCATTREQHNAMVTNAVLNQSRADLAAAPDLLTKPAHLEAAAEKLGAGQ